MRQGLTGLGVALFAAPALFLVYQAATPAALAPLGRLAATVLPGYLASSALLALAAAALAAAIGVGTAYLAAFHDFPGRRWLDAALVLPLVLPTYLVAIVYREMAHRHAWSPPVESPPGAVALFALTLYPYVYLLARAAFRRRAASFEEIGRSLGLDRRRIVARVLLPLAAPAILLGALLVAIETISDFGTTSVLGLNTLTTAIHRIWFTMFDATLAAQVALLGALLPLLLVAGYALAIRGRGFANPSNRPRPAPRSPLSGRWRTAAPLLCALPVLFGFAWPLAVLLAWAGEAFARLRLDTLYRDLLDTLVLAAGTTAAAVSAGLALALAMRAARRRGWRPAVLGAVSLDYALPAIVLAVALLSLTGWTYGNAAGAWLADSALLVLLAATLHFTAFALYGAESGLRDVSPRIDEAIRCAGVRRLHGLRRGLLPLVRGPLRIGGLLVFVVAAKELTLPLVLQPFGYRPLALSIYYFADVDRYGPAALNALCLALVVVYPVLSIHRWFGTR